MYVILSYKSYIFTVVLTFLDLDYKRLIDPAENPLDIIRPVLNTANINPIAKMAPKIPIGTSGASSAGGSSASLTASVVYCAWALKHFWEGTSATGKKGQASEPQAQSDWIHRYT